MSKQPRSGEISRRGTEEKNDTVSNCMGVNGEDRKPPGLASNLASRDTPSTRFRHTNGREKTDPERILHGGIHLAIHQNMVDANSASGVEFRCGR